MMAALWAALFIAPTIASGEEKAPSPPVDRGQSDAGFVITHILFEGRFQTSLAELGIVTELRKGEIVDRSDIAAAEGRLRDTGLYSAIAIRSEEEPGGRAVIVTLTEKLTFIPIPVASFSSGSSMFGLFAIASDFLGSGATLITGGIWATGGPQANLGFFDRRLGTSELGLNAFFSAGFAQKTPSYENGMSYFDYGQRYATAVFSINAFPRSELQPLFLGEIQWAIPNTAETAAQGLPAELFALGPGLGLSFERLSDHNWFKSGVMARASSTLGLSLIGDSPFWQTDLRASASAAVFQRDKVSLGGKATYGTSPSLAKPLLMGAGYRTLPFGDSYSSKALASFIQYEFPFAQPRWAVFTLCAFYEAGFYEVGPDTSSHFQGFSGPGLGFRLYLSRVAIPAIGIDYAFNLQAGTFVLSIVAGMPLN
jgi:hypothetical protein